MTIDQILKLPIQQRAILSKITAWFETDHILLITGSRQVGKTYTLFLIIQWLVKNRINQNKIYYFDFEDFELLEICNKGPRSFIQYLKTLGETFDERIFVCFDEIQYLDNPTNFLKLLHDHYKKIKIFCSGSSTLDIRRKFQDSLVGRKLIFELYSLSFEEFLSFNGQESLINILKQYDMRHVITCGKIEELPSILTNDLVRYFDEHIRFGGYPASVLNKSHDHKAILLNEIYQTYVRKDINQLFTIENISAFNNLIRLLGFQIGELINLNELAASISSGWKTVENYLLILENTFILKRVFPFFSNKRKELTKMPKVFFHDLGLRNQLIKNSNPLDLRNDSGHLVENFVFQQLYRNLKVNEDIKFWRSQNKNEVDFIVEAEEIIPIEVKYKVFRHPQIPQGIRFFIQQYPCKIAFVVTKNFLGTTENDGCKIYFIPVYLFNYL
ncbi:ATP-binding protein, partial [candidate division KSB1 bacterium]|nr:ATP-binding protein [candidate division KSB1 bacterium]